MKKILERAYEEAVYKKLRDKTPCKLLYQVKF